MKKYIIGFVLGSVLFSSGIVLAKVVEIPDSWIIVDNLNSSLFRYEKSFDKDTNVVCYSVRSKNSWETASISCLKNN